MPEIIKQKILVPLDGLSQEAETDGTTLGEETFNFFPDGEGYLVNYPGKTPYFREVQAPEDTSDSGVFGLGSISGTIGSAQNVYTTPPSGKFTRIEIYRDSSGQQHIVFVVDNKLCVVEGNGYREIYTFSGITHDDASYPNIFVHQNKLIIANLGDPMLLWDGFQDVVPLGVTEIPDPPSTSVGLAPWYTKLGKDKNQNNRDIVIHSDERITGYTLRGSTMFQATGMIHTGAGRFSTLIDTETSVPYLPRHRLFVCQRTKHSWFTLGSQKSP